MMNHHVNGSNFSQTRVSGQQLIMTALRQSISDLLHIDELFLWLSYALVHHFGLPVVQIWAARADSTDQITTELRAIAYENDSLPQHVILNSQVAALASRVISQSSDYTLVRVKANFSSSRMAVLDRYGLHYCSGHFLSSSALLPPVRNNLSDELQLTPLAAAIVFFLSQPLLPEQRESVEYILNHAIQLAEYRGLLLPSSEAPGQLQTSQQQSLLILSKLIPHHKEEIDLMRSINPLADAIVISDKQARRLYAAIDDRRNLAELRTITKLDMDEIITALQLLLSQQRIQLYDEEGQAVNISSFFKEL